MKTRIVISLFIINLLVAFSLFSEDLDVVETCSFGVFRSQYGNIFDTAYWQNGLECNYYFHTGICNDFMNYALAVKFLGCYFSGNYNGKLMGNGSWPNERTDMNMCLMAGIPKAGIGVKVSYLDKNVYKGIGTAAPKIEIGKTFRTVPLALGFSCEGQFHYWTGLKLDVVQVPFSFKIDFSRDGLRGAGVSYTVMPTIKSSHAVNDVSELKPMQGFSAWAGWCWNIGGSICFGLHPSFMMNFNTVNTTNYKVNERLLSLYGDGAGYLVENTNWIPENGNLEWRATMPFAFIYKITDKLEFISGFMSSFYWANFEHLSKDSNGGCNLDGLSNESGFGIGIRIDMNKNALFQIGMSAIRQVSIETGSNKSGKKSDYALSSSSLSADSLFRSPLSASLTLKF